MNENSKKIINAKPVSKLVLRASIEALISAFIILVVLYMLKKESFEQRILAYVLTSIIIFFIVFFMGLLKILFQARIRFIRFNDDELEIQLRIVNLLINVNWKDIKHIKKLKIKENVKTNIILENGTKIPVWSTGFDKKTWLEWEDTLVERKYIKKID